jgi:glycosyltransferase involved in cell wall biosynthesis
VSEPSSTSAALQPVVAILLCTYNGEQFLAEQLDSIKAQTHTNWRLWVSDDGSSDSTLDILKRYQNDWDEDRLMITTGPRAGSTRNFLTLTANPEIQAEGYAWADQDDVWEPEKIARSIAFLQAQGAGRPVLYGTRTLLTDGGNRPIGHSALFTKPPSFANALVQSIAGGNTMMFNHAARQLLAEAAGGASPMAHDWWAYQVISGCGGLVHYDPWPSVRYRQHGGNQIGSNLHPTARLLRLRLLMGGSFSGWVAGNLDALAVIRHRMSPPCLATLDAFEQGRRKSAPRRLMAFHKARIHRQTLVGNVGLLVAAVLGKV